MSKQTAVEWLSQQILDNWNDIHHGARNVEEFIIQAMAMEKEQIIEATYASIRTGEDYYNETYVNKEIEEIKSEFVCQMEDCPHCAYEEQERYEAALEKDAAVEFGEWLLKECGEFTTIPMEQLYQLYLKSEQ